MATHSSVLAWRIPGTGGAWWAAVYGVAQSWTRLKWLTRAAARWRLKCSLLQRHTSNFYHLSLHWSSRPPIQVPGKLVLELLLSFERSVLTKPHTLYQSSLWSLEILVRLLLCNSIQTWLNSLLPVFFSMFSSNWVCSELQCLGNPMGHCCYMIRSYNWPFTVDRRSGVLKILLQFETTNKALTCCAANFHGVNTSTMKDQNWEELRMRVGRSYAD